MGEVTDQDDYKIKMIKMILVVSSERKSIIRNKFLV